MITYSLEQRRLQWFGHIMRREEDHVCKRTMNMEVQGTRKRGRPKMRWRDAVNRDMREKNVSERMAQDRRRWRRLIANSDPI